MSRLRVTAALALALSSVTVTATCGGGGQQGTTGGTASDTTSETSSSTTAAGTDSSEETEAPTATTGTTEPPAPTGTLPDFFGEVPRNLLVISIDTLRIDMLARYGGDPALMPFLGQLADEGFALDDHRSCSNWTYASMMCFLLGQTNVESGFIPQLSEMHRAPLPEGIETLATWLSGHGYYTMLSSANGWFSGKFEMDRGFVWNNAGNAGGMTFMYNHARPTLKERVASGEPWYYHLHAIEPHAAYNPPEEYLKELEDLPPISVDLTNKDDHYSYKAMWPNMSDEERELLLAHLWVRYRGELRYLDDQLAAMWPQMREDGVLDDTLVVIISDHGEQFWEHGDQTHGYDFHPEENDALAVFWAENIIPGAWDEPTDHIDLAPTILHLLDYPVPAGVTGARVGAADPDRPEFGVSACKIGLVQSVRAGDRKLQYNWWGSRSFYRLDEDPLELVDVYDPADPDVIALWELLLPRVMAADPLIPQITPKNPGP